MSKVIYSEYTYFKNSDINHKDLIKPQGILSIFEDIAGRHAGMIDIGYESLMKKNLAWVVVRTKYTFYKMSNYGDMVNVITWPHKRGRIDFDRDYRCYSLSGDLLFEGSSKWILIDMSTRQISRAKDIDVPGDCLDLRVYNDLPKLRKPDLEFKLIKTHTVSVNDIDHNMHMNNIRYVELIYETFNLDTNMPHSLTVEYIHESKYGETLNISVAKENNKTYYLIESDSNEKVLILLEDKDE